jgi:hypothetical protein
MLGCPTTLWTSCIFQSGQTKVELAFSTYLSVVAFQSMTVSVYRKLRLHAVLCCAALLCVLQGAGVTDTIRSGITNLSYFNERPDILAYGASFKQHSTMAHHRAFLPCPVTVRHNDSAPRDSIIRLHLHLQYTSLCCCLSWRHGAGNT